MFLQNSYWQQLYAELSPIYYFEYKLHFKPTIFHKHKVV